MMDRKQEVGKRLASARRHARLKQADAATRVGVHYSTLAKYESGDREPDGETMAKLAALYNVTTDWIITGKNINSASNQNSTNYAFAKLYSDETDSNAYINGVKITKGDIQEIDIVWVRVLGNIRAGFDLYADEQVIGLHPVPPSDMTDGAEYFCLRVQGDSMTGDDIADGDTVLVRRQNFIDDAKIAVVIYNGDEGTLKRVSFQNGMAVLESSNPSYPAKVVPPDEVHIQGQAVKVYKEKNL